MNVAPLAERIADVLRRHAPLMFCSACLSRRVGAPEKDIKDAAQHLVLTRACRLEHRMCQGCGKVEPLLELLPA